MPFFLSVNINEKDMSNIHCADSIALWVHNTLFVGWEEITIYISGRILPRILLSRLARSPHCHNIQSCSSLTSTRISRTLWSFCPDNEKTEGVCCCRCISVGTRKGYSITNCDPFGRVYTKSECRIVVSIYCTSRCIDR